MSALAKNVRHKLILFYGSIQNTELFYNNCKKIYRKNKKEKLTMRKKKKSVFCFTQTSIAIIVIRHEVNE